MLSIELNFSEEKNGYNKEQVESFIDKLYDAYHSACLNAQLAEESLSDLLKKFNRLEKQAKERTGLNSRIVANTLRNMELLARKMNADAQREASSRAKVATEKVIDEVEVKASASKKRNETGRRQTDGQYAAH